MIDLHGPGNYDLIPVDLVGCSEVDLESYWPGIGGNLRNWHSDFLCIAHPDSIKLRGNYYSIANGTGLRIMLGRCSGHDHCAEESEIDKFIDESYVFYTTNSQSYNPQNYTDGVIEDFNFIDAERMEQSDPKEVFYSIQENIVDSEHQFFDVGAFTENYTFFT